MIKRQASLGFLLADVSRMMRHAFQAQIENGSLTLAQARALVYVSRNEGVRQIELAELLEIKPITLARLIDQLQTHGLVERRPDPGDRRAYRIFLMPAATAYMIEIERVGGNIRKKALRGLNKQQVETLLQALDTIRDNLAK